MPSTNKAKRFVAGICVTSVAIYGVLWTFAESISIPAGFTTFFIISGLSSITGLIWSLISEVRDLRQQVTNLQADASIFERELTLARASKSYCCIVKQETSACPLGVTRIIPHTEETIRSSLAKARRSLRWYGLSAFNVLHNNYDLFEKKRDVQFDFSILSKENMGLIKEVDRYFGDVRGKLNAEELIKESEKLIKRVQSDLNSNVSVHWHNQMPTFRIIAVDGSTTYVSFYQRGIDALKSFQLELSSDVETKFPIKDWFDAYIEKCLITEKYRKSPESIS